MDSRGTPSSALSCFSLVGGDLVELPGRHARLRTPPPARRAPRPRSGSPRAAWRSRRALELDGHRCFLQIARARPRRRCGRRSRSMSPIGVDLAHRPAVGLEVVDHRRGLGVILAQPVADDLLGVVARAVEHAAPQRSQMPARFGGLATRGSCAWQLSQVRRPADALDQLLLGSVEHDHPSPSPCRSRSASRPSASACGTVRGKPSSRKPPRRPAAQALLDELDHELVGHQLALVHEAPRRWPSGVSTAIARAQHVAGRDVRDPEALREPLRLRPFPGAGRTEQQEVLTQRPASSRTWKRLAPPRLPVPRVPRPRMRGPRGP